MHPITQPHPESSKGHALSPRRAALRRAGPYLLLGLLCTVFFWPIWTPIQANRASFASGDFSGQFYAYARYQAGRIWDGQLPLWNPYASAGHPFLADVQSATFYPLRWLSILLSGPHDFPYLALEWEAIAHVFLAGAFTYAFAWRLLNDRMAALASAVVFAFGGYLTSYPILQLAILETMAWLPLILLLVDRSLTSPLTSSRNAATIGAGLAWGVASLAGHPQTAMHVAYASLIYGAWRGYTARLRAWEIAARLAVFSVAGLGASAAQWIPSLEFMQQSTRSSLSYEALAGGLPLQDVAQMLLPGTTSTWSPLYVGVLPLALAIVSGRRGTRGQAVFWLCMAAGAFLVALGGETFVYGLLYRWLPGFNLFRGQERAAGVASFALAMAAGAGLAALRCGDSAQRRNRLRRLLRWTAMGLIAWIAVSFALWHVSRGESADVAVALDRGVFALVLVVASLAWLSLGGERLKSLRPPLLAWLSLGHERLKWLRLAPLERLKPLLRASGWPAIAIALIVFDLFTINGQTDLERRPPEMQARLPDFLAHVQADPDRARVDGRGLLGGNWGNLAGLHAADGISPLLISDYARVRDALPKEREWRLFNVKYVATHDNALSAPAELIARNIWQGRPLNLFRLPEPAPRAWLVHRVRAVDDSAALRLLADPEFDPIDEALVEQPVVVEDTDAESAARIVSYLPERIVIDVDTPADGLLVVSELYFPGWRAALDGVETPILRTNVALRGVLVPVGRHRVEMTFEPASVVAGLGIFAATWIAGLAAITWLYVRRGV